MKNPSDSATAGYVAGNNWAFQRPDNSGKLLQAVRFFCLRIDLLDFRPFRHYIISHAGEEGNENLADCDILSGVFDRGDADHGTLHI